MELNDYGKVHIPMKFTWEMTEKCNLNCQMCYSRAFKGCNERDELSTNQAKKLLKKLDAENVLYLLLDGGEPLLREDFFYLLPVITEKFCTWISTNGTLIDYKSAKEIKNNHVNTVFVSLHASNSDLHDKITRTIGSFQKTLVGIENLKNQGVQTMVSCQVSSLNYDDISEFVKICKYYQIEKINFLRPYPIGTEIEAYNSFALNANEFEQFVRKAERECEKEKIKIGHAFSYKNHNCCKQSFSCDSRGMLMNCPYLRFLPRLGNAIEDNLVERWNSKESLKIRNFSNIVPKSCQTCIGEEECQGGCTAGRLLGNKRENDFICNRKKIYFYRNKSFKSGYPRIQLEMDVNLFLYDNRQGREYILNKAAMLLWEFLEVKRTEDEICEFFISKGIYSREEAFFKTRKICDLLISLDAILVEFN